MKDDCFPCWFCGVALLLLFTLHVQNAFMSLNLCYSQDWWFALVFEWRSVNILPFYTLSFSSTIAGELAEKHKRALKTLSLPPPYFHFILFIHQNNTVFWAVCGWFTKFVHFSSFNAFRGRNLIFFPYFVYKCSCSLRERECRLCCSDWLYNIALKLSTLMIWSGPCRAYTTLCIQS